jgi:integrase
MPKSNLTERIIAAMAAPDPSGKQKLHWDSDLKGFAVLCSGTTKAKSFIVQRDLASGKTRRLTVARCNEISLEKARDLAADMLLDLRHGVDPKNRDGAATLQTILNKYLIARRDLSPSSVRVYRQVEKYLEPWLELPLRAITADMIEARHRSLAADVGEFTANGVMRTFRALWNFYAERVPDLPANPVKILKRQWFAEPRRRRMIPPDKMLEFYRAVCGLENKIASDLLLLITFTGFRKGEASSLRWENIDWKNRTITIPAAATKGKRELVLPMSDFVHGLLVARRALGDATFVFPGRKRGHVSDLGNTIKVIEKRTGIVFSAHDLRRGFSTVAESVGVSMSVLKALLNHAASRDVTAGYIISSDPEQLREPVQRIANRLEELCGIAPPAGNVAKLKRSRK